MPNLDFYAVDHDRTSVLDAVFELGLFRVFEAFSEPDCELREFKAARQILVGERAVDLMLYADASGPEPSVHRIDLRPGALGDATVRYQSQGWGLIQLYFGGLFKGEVLRWSHTNHNTEKRAAKWLDTLPELGDPAAWDWPTVTRASSKLNRVIRAMAVAKVGSHPVLPEAAELMKRRGLKYEYGIGIHANQSSGISTPTNLAY